MIDVIDDMNDRHRCECVGDVTALFFRSNGSRPRQRLAMEDAQPLLQELKDWFWAQEQHMISMKRHLLLLFLELLSISFNIIAIIYYFLLFELLLGSLLPFEDGFADDAMAFAAQHAEFFQAAQRYLELGGEEHPLETLLHLLPCPLLIAYNSM